MLTDRQIKAMKPREGPYRVSEDTNRRGYGRLVLEIKPNGAKYFFFQYFRKQDGKSNKTLVSIGRFKDSAKMVGYSLSDARDVTLEYGNILKQGMDVRASIEEKQLEQRERIRKVESAKLQGSLDQLIESYLSAMEANGKRSHESVRRSLRIYLNEPFPELIKRKADTIEAGDIRLVLSRMIDKGVTTHTNRVRSYLRAAFSHGLKQDNDPRRYSKEAIKFNLKYNPVSHVPHQTDFERVGEHVISEDEIKIIWHELEEESLVSLLIKLALTTGQRVGELSRLKWDNVNFKEKLFTIPASVSKNKLDHVVPMDALSLSVVNSLHKKTVEYDHLFPGSYRGELQRGKIIHSTTIARAIREFCKEKKISKFITRDIRRTWKTLAGKAGIDKQLRDRIQNHALRDVSSKHYDRYDYVKEKRHGLKVWNDYLDLVINPRKKVTHISKKRA